MILVTYVSLRLLAWWKIYSCNHLVTTATDIRTSFLLFKEWKQLIVKNTGAVTFFNVETASTRRIWNAGFLRGCCAPAQVCYSTQQTGDIWRQSTREINENTCDHYASLTFWRFHPLSGTPIFTLNMIYGTCLLRHEELSHRWEIISRKPDTSIYNHCNFWTALESMRDDGEHHVNRRSDLCSSRKEGV